MKEDKEAIKKKWKKQKNFSPKFNQHSNNQKPKHQLHVKHYWKHNKQKVAQNLVKQKQNNVKQKPKHQKNKLNNVKLQQRPQQKKQNKGKFKHKRMLKLPKLLN